MANLRLEKWRVKFFVLFFLSYTLFPLKAAPNFNENNVRSQIDSILAVIVAYYVESDAIQPETLWKKTVLDLTRYYILTPGQTTLEIEINANKRINFPADQVFSYEDLRDRLTQLVKILGEANLSPIGKMRIDALRLTSSLDIVMNSLLESMDAHSAVLSQDSYKDLKQGTDGSFGGLGLVVGIRNYVLSVLRVMPGSPAAHAGILRGDKILEINSQKTFAQNLDQLVDKMRGEPGSEVKLIYLREDFSSPKTLVLKRQIIDVESVNARLLTYQDTNILFASVESFSSRTTKELKEALRKAREKLKDKEKLGGLILDLRGNPGGLLEQAIQMSDLFLDKGVIVSTKGRREEFELARENNDEPYIPMVLLVDGDSASASEIVAGALQDNDRALVLGQPTFGKGSVQTIFELPEERAIKLTIARYYTPANRSIQNVGITPDILVHPVQKKDKNKNLLGFFRYRNERFLQNHLINSSSLDFFLEQSKSLVKLFYLTEQNFRERWELNLDEKPDLETKLASDILVKLNKIYKDPVLPAEARRSKHWLFLAKDEIKKWQGSYNSQTLSWLAKKHNINWHGNTYQEPKLSLTFKESSQRADEEELKILYEVTNTDIVAANEVSVFATSDELSNPTQEVLLGVIHPGQTTKGEFTIQLDEQRAGIKTAQIRLSLASQGIPLMKTEKEIFVPLPQKIDPLVELKIDSRFIGKSSSSDVELSVKNIGSKVLNNILVSAINLSGKQIDILLKEPLNISNLAEGQERKIKLPLKIKDLNAPNNVEFGVIVEHSEKQRYVTKLVSIPIKTKAVVSNEGESTP